MAEVSPARENCRNWAPAASGPKNDAPELLRSDEHLRVHIPVPPILAPPSTNSRQFD